MACDQWSDKFEAYFDGELSPDDQRAVADHLGQCSACAARALELVQQKRAVQAAARRYLPDSDFRARIQKQIAAPKRKTWGPEWLPAFVAASAATLLVGALLFFNYRQRQQDEQLLVGELLDQHVATMASANPVDVVSTDRHTVKPWFQGKIPFTFDLPELTGTPFTLIGGRMAYLRQAPGAELIFKVRQHQISVFIFQDRGTSPPERVTKTDLAFQVRSWREAGLRYFAVGDASGSDLDQLRDLLKAAR